MRIALICSAGPLEDELKDTAVFREDVVRHIARDQDEAVTKAMEVVPSLVLVDRDMPGADRVVITVRRDSRTRKSSIVVVATDDFDPIEVNLLEFGANAVLRLPVDDEWHVRLERLMEVPVRREVRVPVEFEMEARSGDGVEMGAATVLNISINGMLIDSAFPLKIGDDIDVIFKLPGSSDLIYGTGHVVRQAGRTQFGISFYGLEGDGQERIAAFIENPPD